MEILFNLSARNAKNERPRRRGIWSTSKPNPRPSPFRMELRVSNFPSSATLSITVWTTTPSGRQYLSVSGWFLIYLASVDAILQDHHDNVIDRAQLPLLFNISGKSKQPVKARKARKRAVRGVSAPQHSNYYTPSLKLLLISEIV